MTPDRDFQSNGDGAVAWHPGKLWSLWDMLKFNGATFHDACSIISRAREAMVRGGEQDKNKKLSDGDKKRAPVALRLLQGHAKILGAKVTEVAVVEILASFKDRKRPLNYGKLLEQVVILENTLRRELSLIHLYVIEGDTHKYFAPSGPLFGKEVDKNLPSASYEIDEAGKCLALGRPTASVFHMMRIMEISIKAIARCLNIPDPIKPSDRNWGAILIKIKAAMDARTSASGWKTSDKEVFESAYVTLDAVRAAWRNTTMHVENKYTPDEAEHILLAVRAFMTKVASRMDEQGIPLA